MKFNLKSTFVWIAFLTLSITDVMHIHTSYLKLTNDVDLVNHIGLCRMLSQRIYKHILLNNDKQNIEKVFVEFESNLERLESYKKEYELLKRLFEEYKVLIRSNNYKPRKDILAHSDKLLKEVNEVVFFIEEKTAYDLKETSIRSLLLTIISLLALITMYFDSYIKKENFCSM
jgi:hypothetical protein